MANILKIYFQNVRGLRTKTADFYLNMLTCDYDIIVLCETWLAGDILDSELFCDRYLVYRRDRESSGFHNNKSGGGVLIAVSKRLSSCRLCNCESKCEDVWVSVDIYIDNKLEKLFICGVYIPPPVQRHILEHFLDGANRVLEKSVFSLIMGDFNLGSIEWTGSVGSPLIPSLNKNSMYEHMLLDFIALNNLNQYNCILNDRGRILDLVLSNISVNDLGLCVSPLTNVDTYHPPLEFQLLCGKGQDILRNNHEPRYKFHKANYCNIVQELKEILWCEKLSQCSDVNAMVELFYDILNKIIVKHVPKSKSAGHKYPAWYSTELIRVLREKNKYRIRYSKFKNPLDNISYRLLKDRALKLTRSDYKNYITSIESSITSNPKLFWSYLKQKRNGKSTYPSTMHYGDSTARNGTEVCDLFASCFSSLYATSSSGTLDDTARPIMTYSSVTPALCNFSISRDMVEKALKRLDPLKGAGSDGLPSAFVVKCSEVVAEPLYIIYNKSLSTGCFPSAWKEALVVPVYKSGDRSNVNNYRPVSILPIFGKVFESIIYPIVFWHVKHILLPEQHGFIKARSAATNLASFMSDVVDAVDCGYPVDVIYTDFSKAFDRVYHKILIHKLFSFGITGNLLSWCASYLAERSSKVVINSPVKLDIKILTK